MKINRRMFLVRGSVAAAAAGVATVIPLGPVLTETQGPAEESVASGEAAAGTTEPLVAHVRDLQSGEIGLYSGDREIILHDTGLANRLFNATR